LEAVEAVANAEGDLEIVEVLSALVDHSLLKQVLGVDGEPRYSMLETVREYGWEELAVSSEEAEIRRRHAAWCLDAAVTAGHVLWTDYNPRVVERLETELANLLAARDWFEQAGDNTALTQLAAALGYFLYLSRHYREGREWMEQVLAIREPPTAEHARIMLWSGILDIGLGDDNAALKRLEQSADLARVLDLPDVEGVAVLGQRIVLEDRADYAEAEALLIRSLALLRKAGNDVVVPQAIYHLGVVAYGRGEMTLARERWEEALALAQDQGNAVAISWCQEMLGLLAAEQGDLERSADALGQVVDRLTDTMHQHQLEDSLAVIAVLGSVCDADELAARLFGTAHAARASGHASTPPESEAYERVTERLRTALGVVAYEEAFTEGGVQGITAALADARAVLGAARALVERDHEPITKVNSYGLTSRELEVLHLLAAGRSNEQIGDALFISPRTAQTHVTHLLAKLGLTNRTEAASFAHKHQIN
jgi:non-specific serine/threonine protein kinase